MLMFHFRRDGEIVQHGISFYKYVGDEHNRSGFGVLISIPLWALKAQKYYDILKDDLYFGSRRKIIHFSIGSNGVRFICGGGRPIGEQCLCGET